MACSRWGLLVCAAAAALCGCSISPTLGETMAECSNGDDDDDDGMADCRDPDCQALSECAASVRIRKPVAPGPGQLGDAYVREPPDTSVPDQPDGAVDAAHMPDEPPDASAVPDTSVPVEGCPDGCPENQTCVVDQCRDDVPVVVEHWDITRVELRVPRSIAEDGLDCLDTGVACIVLPVPAAFPLCTCPPDPLVQFWVDVDPTDDMDPELAGQTSIARVRDEAIWRTPDITLGVAPTSEVSVKVFDDDGSRDQLIFDCPFAGDVVTGGGPIECTRLFPPGEGGAEFYVRAEVAPGQAPPPE